MLALASCFGLSPVLAEAAGLGRISVHSALGQPLRAEIELNASREELAGMTAKVAAPDAFKLAGIEYASTLSSIKFAIEKRPNGQSIVRVTSERPVSDPFVDMLIELAWPAGRLVREYTFLLDPPEMAAKAAPAVSTPPATGEKVEPKPVPSTPAPAAEIKVAPPTKAEVAATKKAEVARTTIEVKRGDTLRKIANEAQSEGVSLDQMLVGLFRANRDAFAGGNMNRLQAGKILNVPAAEDVAAISANEAHKEIVAQAADWNAYRRKLAGAAAQMPAAEAAGKQEAGGKITAKVESKTPLAADAKDQVKVSKTETAAGAPAIGKKAGEEEKVAKGKALSEAQERVAALEKNVTDLQKMVELKNQNLANLQKQATAKAPAEAKKPEPTPAAKPAEPTAAAKPAEPAKPAPAPAPAAAPTPPAPAAVPVPPPAAEKPAEPLKPADAAKPADVKPVEVAKPVDAKSAEAKPAETPKPKPKAAVPPPEPESSFIEEFGGMLGLGAALAALIGGFVFWKRRKSQAEESPSLSLNTLSHPSLGANSVFRATGGQSVDTSNVTPATTDFSQAGPGMIDTDEVDPVAEAEVYMAYGRDAQAEEILLEAMQKDSKRLAIHVKLLEIYSNRKNLKQFEALATELYGQTNGNGAEWEKAAAMGLRLDPTNSLYSRGSAGASAGASAGGAAAFDAEATLIAQSTTELKSMGTTPRVVSPVLAAEVAPMAAASMALDASDTAVESLDFDLGIDAVAAATPVTGAATEEKISFDFDLDAGSPMAVDAAASPASVTDLPAEIDAAPMSGEDLVFAPQSTIIQPTGAASEAEAVPEAMAFDLPDIELAPPPAAQSASASVATAATETEALDFDLGFGSSTEFTTGNAVESSAPAAEIIDIGSAEAPALDFDVRLTDSMMDAPPTQRVDLSSISLDLDSGESSAAGASAAVAAGGEEVESAEVATKLDLAKAYEEMGDHEGARELLQEVLAEGNATQKTAAQAMLDKLG